MINVKGQIRQTDAKLILVHPQLAGTAVSTAIKAGEPKEGIFLFSDSLLEPGHGLKEIRSEFDDSETVRDWQWPTYSERQCENDVAVIKFSSV